jgi:hypothetical protein
VVVVVLLRPGADFPVPEAGFPVVVGPVGGLAVLDGGNVVVVWEVVVGCEVVVSGLVAPAHAGQEVVATDVPRRARAAMTPPASRDVCLARRWQLRA